MTGFESMPSWSNAYRRHGRAVRSFLLRRLGSREEADDLCQETFMRAMKARERLRDPSKLPPYLFRIAHNLLANHYRRRRVVSAESDLGGELELAADPARYSPEARQDWRELAEAVCVQLQALPAEQRRAFELGVLQRRPYAEISELTGWSRSKVKINVYRARQKLITGLSDFRPLELPRNDRRGKGA